MAPTISQALGLPPPGAAVDAAIPEIAGDLVGSVRLAVLAPDGLGLTAWRRWQAQMPLLTLVHAKRHLVLRSVAPVITPVNFATIITGASPDVHGVNTKHDTVGCDSLFEVVRKAGGTSAGAGRPGYTGGEFLARHADISGRAPEATDAAVAETVIALCCRHLPTFVIAQLGEPDTIFHRVGPSSRQAEPVVRQLDALLASLIGELAALHYGIIILSDHGQHDVTPDEEDGYRGWHDGSRPEDDTLVPCTWVPRGGE